MDVLAEHGIAGIIGLIFNALFGATYIIGLDGVSTVGDGGIAGGWLDHNYKQLYIQVAYIVACCAYSFIVSALLAYAINFIPGLRLRASEEAELLGMDDGKFSQLLYKLDITMLTCITRSTRRICLRLRRGPQRLPRLDTSQGRARKDREQRGRTR